jgi:glucose/mannose transport system substrate-binding protein
MLACVAGLWGGVAQASSAELQVLHWWTSASERRAADLLAARLAADGIRWRDAAIPGGAGQGVGKVLRSRVLAGDAPEVTQMIGTTIAEWAGIGVLLELDEVAAVGQWGQVLFPTVHQLVQHRDHVVAAPLGIHRVNLLFVNRRLFDRHRLTLPRNWEEWVATASVLQAAGVTPLALSSEPWQVATLFEGLVLASGGQTLHRQLFVQHEPRAAADPRVLEALQRLRTLKSWAAAPVSERPWTIALQQLQRGDAAMMVMGDWAKGELSTAGWTVGEHFHCLPVPGTAAWHLYSVDSLTMFAKDYTRSAAQERTAALLMQPAVQADYNRIKGSVSPRRDADPAGMDACARDSWLLFAQGESLQAPSLVHRMATDESSKDAIVAELHRFFMNDQMPPAAVQRRLGAMFRVLPQRAARAAAR